MLLILEPKEIRDIDLALLMLNHLMMILVLLLPLVRFTHVLILADNISRSEINWFLAIIYLVSGFLRHALENNPG